MMADKNATAGDENKRKTVCDDSDDDKSGDKWLVPNGKMGEYEDRGGPGEASGQDDMQSFDKWSRPPSEEDWDSYNTKSVGKYEDQGGTGKASGQDYMQSFDKWSPPPTEEDWDNYNTKSVGKYEDQGGTGETSGQDDMQSFDKWSPPPTEEDWDIDNTKSVAEYPQSDEEGTDEDSDLEDIPDSSNSGEEDWNTIRNESVAEYAQSDEEGTDEDSDQECIQDSSDSSEENWNNHRIESDDVDKTLEQNRQYIEHIRADLSDKLTSLGPQKMAEYIQQHLDRWKTEKVKLAVAGQSATGKSTFINTFLGIKEGQDGFVDVGFGDETEKISEYKQPVNENIIFCDLPGLSMKVTKQKFLEMVNLSEYSYILIFFESILTDGDEWLTVQIQEKGIPFCLIRSKVDKDVESYKGREIGEKGVLLKSREKIKDSMSTNTAFAKAELFLISSEKPHIGEMSNLQDHMKEKLPSNQFSAVMFSLPILTKRVIEKKILELEHRMPYVSIGASIITALPLPLIDISIIIALIKREIWHYIKVFGLDQRYNENIKGLKNNYSVGSIDDFVDSVFTRNYINENGESVPTIDSLVKYNTRVFVNVFLSYILFKLKQDAITVFMHFLNTGSR